MKVQVVGGAVGALLLLAGGASAFGLVHVPFLPKLHLPRGRAVPAMVTVPAIVTNLSGADASHFAQIAMTLQLSDRSQAQLFDKRQAAVENALITDIRNDSVEGLSGSGGMALLRREVTASLDRVLGQSGAIEAVYFTQFIVQ